MKIRDIMEFIENLWQPRSVDSTPDIVSANFEKMEDDIDDAVDEFAKYTREAKNSKNQHSQHRVAELRALNDLAWKALRQLDQMRRNRDINKHNPFAIKARLGQLHSFANALPEEIIASLFEEEEQYPTLAAVLRHARGEHRVRSDAFIKYATTKTTSHLKLNEGMFEREFGIADEKATEARKERLEKAGADAATLEKKSKSFLRTARDLKKKRRQLNLTNDDAEDLAGKGLDAILIMKELIVPKWGPEHTIWLLSMSEKTVYHISLASIPEELFKQTESYEGIQNLMKNESVFAPNVAREIKRALKRTPNNSKTKRK